MKVGSIVLYRDKSFGFHRFYEVIAVCLGVGGSVSLVRLKSMNENPGMDEHGNTQETVLVPCVFLRDCEVFNKEEPTP